MLAQLAITAAVALAASIIPGAACATAPTASAPRETCALGAAQITVSGGAVHGVGARAQCGHSSNITVTLYKNILGPNKVLTQKTVHVGTNHRATVPLAAECNGTANYCIYIPSDNTQDGAAQQAAPVQTCTG